MRNGLALLLARVGHTVCGEAESRDGVLACIDEAGADLALVDMSLAEESGLDMIDDFSARSIPTLIYSMHEDPRIIERAFNRGAKGYVTKCEVAGVLLEAIATVFSGQAYASPQVQRSLASLVVRQGEDKTIPLSPREKQIMAGLGHGETSSEIGAKLGISAHTVETYYARMIKKSGVDNMKELRKLAIKQYA